MDLLAYGAWHWSTYRIASKGRVTTMANFNKCEYCENPAIIEDWGAELCADCWDQIDTEIQNEVSLKERERIIQE